MKSINSTNRERELPAEYFVDRLPAILSELSYAEENNCLKVWYQSTIFFIHLNQGQLVYATNSVAPFERLERHLRRLSNQNSQITNSTIKQPRQQFTNDLQTYDAFPTDYRSILWLVEAGHLNTDEAIALIRRITREVFESFLCLPNLNSFKLIPRSNQIKELCRFDLNSYIEQCRKRLKAWDAFEPQVFSSYQRPYLVNAKDHQISGLSPKQNETICKLLRGLSFRQISAVIDRDELVVAKILYPSIQDGTIILRDPKTPFDLLPNFPQTKNILELTENAAWRGEDSGFLRVNSHSKQTVMALQTWKIAYVDRDTSAHQTLAECLQQDLFNVLAIVDAMNAFAELIEFQPDLVFVAADLPDIDGYELCSLLRNHQGFYALPIIIVNRSDRSVDEAKSKRAGATSNIAKPLERTRVLTEIWQYLQ